MNELPEQAIINNFLKENNSEVIDLWKQLVNHPSTSSFGKITILKMIDKIIKDKIKSFGFDFKYGSYKTRISSKGHGSTYICDLNLHADNQTPLLFMGHADTVDLKFMGFRLNQQRVTGLGSLDMKGGLVVMLYTVFALLQHGYNRVIRIIITVDEEIGHVSSPLFTKFMIEKCKGAVAALSFETATLNHNLVVKRAGTLQANYTITGKTAHTGKDPDNGIDAIKKAAELILDLTKPVTADQYRITVGKVHGGIARNVIADTVNLEVDIRIFDNQWLNEVRKCLLKWSCVQEDGTIVKVEIIEGIPASVEVPNQKQLINHVKSIANKYSLEIGEFCSSGGASDMAYATLAGVPVLDQMGVEGEHNHTEREYAIVESLYQKIRLAFLIAYTIDSAGLDQVEI